MPPLRADRVRKIKKLQKARDDRIVITYLTSTRPGIQVMMGMDVIPRIYEHLRALGLSTTDKKPIDLFLHTNGGDGVVPWRLITLLREFASELCLLVPHRAFSAGTLTALGVDKVVMHPMGMLGPIDPTVTGPFNPPNPAQPNTYHGISVEDVSAYIHLIKEDVGITHEDELVQAFNILAEKVHPLALGNVKRSSSQSRMMAEKLLLRRSSKLDAHTVGEITEKLGSRLYYHGHPINREEARTDLALDFVEDATPAVEAAMWDLYADYAELMELDRDFNLLLDALALITTPLPGVGLPPVVDVLRLPEIATVYIETTARADIRSTQYQVAVTREWNGHLANAEMQTLSDAWMVET